MRNYISMRSQDETTQHGRVVYALETALKVRGITAKELCKQTGIAPVVLRRSLTGETHPSFGQLARIIAVTGIPLAELLVYVPPT